MAATIKNKIKNIRELKNYTQEYMAERLGVTQAGYSKIEKGKTSLSYEKLVEIGRILDVSVEDIISFDYTVGNLLQGDIFVSIERVRDNAADFKVSFVDELRRVLSHGVLHYCGYKDKSHADEVLMRAKENEKMQMFHVEH